ncbi:Phosphoribosylamine--glycine ligase [Candidatus Hydrogenisulfobacillus filiaventi]|uniref:Phosphoribosylamine--glycine ligase n=1 Tax=Candidatus Hydrogenisulfobacillus filiaventi TaxID=2707344 RepID=A0A6F8ZHQ9_9FIRM|nr:Phosphoribosylamine--glycine ligase [Candidatus Hydrogenisulfobacillus filiaventi]
MAADGNAVLVIGSGAREHALAATLAMSPDVGKIWAWPGNAGIDEVAERVPVGDMEALRQWAAGRRLLVVFGPEAPLAEGWGDRLCADGHQVVGPGQEGARLEASKGWAKQLMQAAGVPTAPALWARTPEELAAAVAANDRWPAVAKQDRLAAGKGVVVLHDAAEARDLVAAWSREPAIWESGVLWERFTPGRECSAIVLTNGQEWAWLPPARDYKRRFDGDAGGNTGGMGAYAPVPWLDAALQDRIGREVLGPTLQALRSRNIAYRGFLYAGLMLTGEGPVVLEFNVRLGDPEAEAILPLVDDDLYRWLREAAEGRLAGPQLQLRPEQAVTVVLAAEGYPGTPRTGDVIRITRRVPRTWLFHGGTVRDAKGELHAAGGRVLAVTALGTDAAEARARAYEQMEAIQLPGGGYRRDIARELTGA